MDISTLMFFDYFVIGFIFLITLYGLFKGFFGTLLTILVWVGSYYFTFLLYNDVQDLLQPYIEKEMTLNITTGLVLFLPIFIMLTIISKSIKTSIQDMRLGVIDRSLGAALGMVASGALMIIIFIIIVMIHNIILPAQLNKNKDQDNAPKFIMHSASYPFLKTGSAILMKNYAPDWLKVDKNTIDEIKNSLERDELKPYLDQVDIDDETTKNKNKEHNIVLEKAINDMSDKALVELYIKLTKKDISELPGNRSDMVKEIIDLIDKK